MSDQGPNPLRILWNFLGTIGGVISLASLAEDWFSKALKWKGFIAQVVQAYQSIVHPVAELLFGWLPCQWPLIVGDYLVLGLLYSASHVRGMEPPSRSYLSEWRARGWSITQYYLYELLFGISIAAVWPIAAFLHFVQYGNPTDPEDDTRASKRRIAFWLVSISTLR